MENRRLLYLILISVLLAVYYLLLGINIQHAGYYNHEALFYIEKAHIIFDGNGSRLKIIGLTAPILPFYGILPFSFNNLLAPVIASAIGTAILFLIIAIIIIKTTNDKYFLLILLILFTFHPGIIFTACSGKGIYFSLIFFFLFFYNIFRFYQSNTTFHISIASILLVALIFCDYRFVWITLFFIPLIVSIAIQSLNLSEKQSIFRMFLSFNNPSLRRKLANKTFAIYVIIFILPLISIICYKILNQTHANDFNYFNDNPYATWNVLIDKLEIRALPVVNNYSIPEVSFLTSIRIIVYCPLILLGIFLFRSNVQYFLTVTIPFALVEFIKIKYGNSFLNQQYYLIFIFMSFLAIIFNSRIISNNIVYKALILVLIIFQIYMGYNYLNNSFIESEKSFISTIKKTNNGDNAYDEYIDLASVINHLPTNSEILVDDANAYPIVAFVKDIQMLTLPYQDAFLSAIENPSKYVDYVLVTSLTNNVSGYTQLNYKYKNIIETRNNTKMTRVYESYNWILYKIIP